MPDKLPPLILDFNKNNTQKSIDIEGQNVATIVEYDSAKNILNQIEKSRSGLEEAIKAENQSAMSQLGNMVVQTGATAIGDLVQSVGAVFDIPSMIGMALGHESEDFENAITKFGNGIIESAAENFPIYRKNPEKSFDFGDLGYWTSQLPGVLGSSLGLMAGGMGMFKLGSKGLSLLKLAPKMSKNGALLVETATEAGIMRHTENFMEAHSVYAQTYDEVSKTIDSLSNEEFTKWKQNLPKDKDIPLDADKETIKKYIAGQAGYRDYRNNTINYAFDFIQMAGILKLKFGKADTRGSVLGKSRKIQGEDKLSYIKTSQTADDLKLTKTDIAKNISFRTGKLLLEQGVTESAEEFINVVSELEGLNYGKVLQGKKEEEGYSNRLKEYIKNPKVWDVAMWGAIGGIVTGVVFKVLGNLTNKQQNKLFEQAEIAEIQTRNFALNSLNATFEKINKGINPKTGKTYEGSDEIIKAEKELDKNNALKEVMRGLSINAVKTGHVSMVLDWLNDKGTLDKYVSIGLGTKEEVSNILKETAKQVEKDEKFYNKVENGLNWTSIKNDKIRDLVIQRVFDAEADKEYYNDQKEFADKKRSEILNNNVYFNSLPENEKTELKTLIDKFAQINTISELKEKVLEMKKEFKDNDVLHSLLDKHIEELKTEFGIDDNTNTDAILKDITNKLKEDTSRGLLDYIVETQKSLIYGKGGKLKDVEIHAFANDKKVADNITKNVEDAVKETVKNNKSTQKLKLNSIIKQGIENVKLAKTPESKKAAEIETINNIKNLKTDKDFVLSGVSADDGVIAFQRELSKNVADDIQQKEEAEKQVFNDESGLSLEEWNAIKVDFSQEEIDDIKLKNIDELKASLELAEKNKIEYKDDKFAVFQLNAYIKLVKHYIDKNSNNNNPLDNIENTTSLDDLNYTEAVQGGPNSVHTYLHHAQKVIFKYQSNGLYTILDNAKKQVTDAFNITVNGIKPGTKVTLKYATANDFNSYDEYQKRFLKSDGKMIIGIVDNVPTLFINDSIYLSDELHLTQSLIDRLDESEFKELFDALKTHYDSKETEENKNKALLEIKRNKVFKDIYANDYLQGEDMQILDEQLVHLKNILFFGFEYDKIKFDKLTLYKSLNDWYSKINQDFVNRNKIIAELDKNGGIAETEFNHVSSGNLIIAADENGKPTLVSLDTSLGDTVGDWKSVPLYVREKNNKYTINPLLEGVEDKKLSPLNKKGSDDSEFKAGLYSSALAGNGTRIPVPLVSSRLEGDTKRIEWVKKSIYSILIDLQNGIKLKDPAMKNKIDKLGDVIVINDKASDVTNFFQFHEPVEKKNDNSRGYTAHAVFPMPNNQGTYVLYITQNEQGEWYQALYKTLNYDTGTHVPVASEYTAQEFENGIKNLQRSYKFERLNNNKDENGKIIPYTDPVTNKTYSSYKEYLIKDNVVKTYVGAVVGNEVLDENTGELVREKISNFSVKPNIAFGSTRPLTATVDTTFKPVRRKQFNTVEQLIEATANAGYGFLIQKALDLGVEINYNFIENEGLKRGQYESRTKTIAFTKLINSRLDKAVNTVAHELIHGIIDNSVLDENWIIKISDYNDNLIQTIEDIKNDKIVVEPEIKRRILNALKSKLDKKGKETNVVLQVLAKIDKNSPEFNREGIEEVITYGLTEKEFADFLQLIPSNVKEKAEIKETFWTKLKNLIIDIIEALTGYNKLDELTDILDEIFTIRGNANESNNGKENTGTETRGEEKRDLGNTNKNEDDYIDLDDINYGENIDDINYEKDLNYIFEQNPELVNIGTKEQYSTYLNTVFPYSKVKDIVYHGSDIKFDKFNKNVKNKLRGKSKTEFIHFTTSFDLAMDYSAQALGYADATDMYKKASEKMDDLMQVIPALINGSKISNENVEYGSKFELNLKGISVNNTIFKFGYDLAVFEPNQIHILGSKKDIEGFKKFVNYKEEDKILYQGYNSLDNRKYNYFTLDVNEASNYGNNIRRITYNTSNLLKGNSTDYKSLVNQDYKLTGVRFDILDNTSNGIKKQNQFFDYLVSKGYKGLDFTMYSDTQYIVLFENVDNIVDNLKYDNLNYDVPLNLQNNKELYKRYNLLNVNDKIKIVPNNKVTANWIKTLNQSPNFTFKLRNTIGGYRILMYPKNIQNYEKILSNLKNVTNEQVTDRIKKCK